MTAPITTLIASARWLLRKSDWYERRADAASRAGDHAQAKRLSAEQLAAWSEAQALLRQTVPQMGLGIRHG